MLWFPLGTGAARGYSPASAPVFLPRIGAARGWHFRRIWALYSHLRFVTAASLTAFAGMIGVGGLALLPAAVERHLVAMAEMSDRPATPCKQQTWLHFDRSCLSRRDLPWITARAPSIATTGASNVVAADDTPEQPLTASRHTATVPQEPVPEASAPRSDIKAPVHAPPLHTAPVQQPAAEVPRATKPASAAQTQLPIPKQAARRDRTAKRPTNEALSAVRKFGDTLQDIPVSGYAADGTRRKIVIRPTSIQDVYYYSAPR